MQRQPSDPIAVYTWTVQENDPVGAVGLCQPSAESAPCAFSSTSQSVSSFVGHLSDEELVLRGGDSCGKPMRGSFLLHTNV